MAAEAGLEAEAVSTVGVQGIAVDMPAVDIGEAMAPDIAGDMATGTAADTATGIMAATAMGTVAVTAMGIAGDMAIAVDSDSVLASTLGGRGGEVTLMPMDIIRTTLTIPIILTPITILQ